MVVKKSSKRAENPIPAEVAGRVRDRFVACFYCGEPAKVEGWDLQVTPLQIEHVVPLHRGGTSDESNLVMACRSCNTSKGSKTVIEYVQYTLYRSLLWRPRPSLYRAPG